MDSAYERLATALDRLPNGFPRTAAGTEIEILKRIFGPEEAALAAELTGTPETTVSIAERVGRSAKDVTHALVQMTRRGLVWFWRADGAQWARLAPFIVGFYEAQVATMDHELAHLVDRYMADGGAAGIMGPEPALQRVVPAQRALRTETILPYDDVRAILEKAGGFHVGDCICRKQQEVQGLRECTFPLDMCLSFWPGEPATGPGSLTLDEALALLDRAETIGLVHSVSNVREGVGYVCNCCGCCCGILRGINEFGIEHSMARANYYAVIDADACSACGVCAGRCQVGAIRVEDVAVVDRSRCIGCGLCVTGCPQDAAHLEPLPETARVNPPVNMAAWEHERLHNRGIAHDHGDGPASAR